MHVPYYLQCMIKFLRAAPARSYMYLLGTNLHIKLNSLSLSNAVTNDQHGLLPLLFQPIPLLKIYS